MNEITKLHEINVVLNRLYTDVVDLMRLLNPAGITDEMKAKYLLSVVDKWTELLNGKKNEGVGKLGGENEGEPHKGNGGEDENCGGNEGNGSNSHDGCIPPPVEEVIAKYTRRPYLEDDGFIFKKCGPMPDDKKDLEGKYYKIKIHPDGLITFAFNDDIKLSLEDLTELESNKSVYFPPEVAAIEGEIKEGSTITTVEEGTVKQTDQKGKRYVVLTPVKLKINS